MNCPECGSDTHMTEEGHDYATIEVHFASLRSRLEAAERTISSIAEQTAIICEQYDRLQEQPPRSIAEIRRTLESWQAR